MKWTVLVMLPLLASRFMGIAYNYSALPSADYIFILRGVFSDMAVGLALGSLLFWLRRRTGRYVPAALWLAWVIMVSSNVEHVRVNWGNIKFGMASLAFQKEFLLGSALSASNLSNLAVVLLSALPAAFVREPAGDRPHAWRLYAFSVIALVSLAAVPFSGSRPLWVQMNVLEENARLAASHSGGAVTVNPKMLRPSSALYRADLDGNKMFGPSGDVPNILLLVLEGISYDASVSPLMPNLKDITSRNLSFSNFVSLQRQTHRGLYGILCGDVPNMITTEAKSDIAGMYGTKVSCLPQLLKAEGYRTVFMQSADLGFMRKDLFTEKAGFMEIIGDQSYEEAVQRTSWGVDDATLYRYALDKADELSAGPGPWFMTLLTSSTHHPYNVPGTAKPVHEQAIIYSDKALGPFISALKDKGHLTNTLVIITSDESAVRTSQGIAGDLSLNHAPLVILHPEVTSPALRRGLFTQSDIALTVLDYLGVNTGKAVGRSFFRSYSGGRELFFGNQFASRIYAFSMDRTLYVCSFRFHCDAYKSSEADYFSTSYEPARLDSRFVEFLRAAVIENEYTFRDIRAATAFSEEDKEYMGSRYLLGEHRLSVRKGEELSWRLSIRSHEELEILIRIQSNEAFLVMSVFPYKPRGDSFSFSYDHKFDEAGSEVRTSIGVSAPDNVSYTVEELRISRR